MTGFRLRFGVAAAMQSRSVGRNTVTNYRGLPAVGYHEMTDFDQIARAARNGDTRAVEALVQSCYADVWRLCALLVDRDSADDLAQEILLEVFRYLPRFEHSGNRGAFRTWLRTIAIHCGQRFLSARNGEPTETCSRKPRSRAERSQATV